MINRTPEKPGDVAFYMSLLVHVLQDAAADCGIRYSSYSKDITTIEKRCVKEGLSFLTKTLPSLGKCLDKALSSDCPLPVNHSFTLQRRSKNDVQHPVFLGAFWKLIFDDTGYIADYSECPGLCEELDALQTAAVRAVRQVCYLFYKLDGSHSKESEKEVLDTFVTTDASLPKVTDVVPLSPSTERALENARLLIWKVLKGFDPWDIHPKHGPGAVATGEKCWEKMNFSRYYEKLDRVYPYSDYFYYNYTHLVDNLEHLENLTECGEPTARVALVPKDSRGPRLISMEPLEIQWIQQGIHAELVREIEKPRGLASDQVNFTSQQVNRVLASNNSYYGHLVTVDMKEASDRVSAWLVKKLFPSNVYACMDACRSTITELPDGRSLELRKFSPMGSAVCFPVEALTFWALAVGSLTSAPLRNDLVGAFPVWVYGDDMICSNTDFKVIRPIFEELYLKFNEDKCCTGRFFRESCGMDSFKLSEVTPLRVKAQWSTNLSPSALLAYVSYVNSLSAKGYTETANYLRQRITESFGSIPVIAAENKHPLAFVDKNTDPEVLLKALRSTFRTRYNKRLQREEVLLKTVTSHVIEHGEPDWNELLRVRPRGAFYKDPFGFESGELVPCRHTAPHQYKLWGKWTPLHELLHKGA